MIDSNSWRTEDLTMGANAKFKETLQKAKQLRSIHLSIATHAQKSELQLLQGLSYVQASRLGILMWLSKLKWLRELHVAKPMGLQKCASLIMFVQMHADACKYLVCGRLRAHKYIRNLHLCLLLINQIQSACLSFLCDGPKTSMMTFCTLNAESIVFEQPRIASV